MNGILVRLLAALRRNYKKELLIGVNLNLKLKKKKDVCLCHAENKFARS